MGGLAPSPKTSAQKSRNSLARMIEYQSKNGKTLSLEEALSSGDYLKVYFENGRTSKAESYYENALKGLYFYNYDGLDHLSIIKANQEANYLWINIKEFEMFSDFKLERQYNYDAKGVFFGTNLQLFDPKGELIAYGAKDEAGQYDYSLCRKFYWDRAVNPDYELFECTYYEDSGLLWELDWFNYHIDPDGQESFVLLNTAEDRLKLQELTGLSNELIAYYMSSEIVPTFGI